MPFPPRPRVVFKKNPIKQVICQLRFPPILRIESGTPVDFQENVRGQYPYFQPRAANLDVPPAELQRLLAVVGIDSPLPGRGYDFRSGDGAWALSLTKDFFALTSTQYEQWEQFQTHLVGPLSSFLEIYKPAFFARIGLRYQNIICRSALGLEKCRWSELLQPYIAGVFASGDLLQEEVLEARHSQLIRLDDGKSQVRIQHGLAKNDRSSEICYLIDNDFFSEEQVDVSSADAVLTYLNDQSGRVFHWCISDVLEQAMGSTPIG